MRKRHQEEIRRHSVLDTDQSASQTAVSGRGQDERRRLRRLLPLLFFAFVAFMIAREEIPLVDAWWQQLVHPQQWAAQETCIQAALADTRHTDYARVLARGTLHPTENGGYLDQLVIGRMGAGGQEEHIRYSCYLDNNGNLVRISRVAG